MKPEPQPGEIWRWHRGENIWTVIIVRHTGFSDWYCICMEDGTPDTWHFSESYAQYWSKLA